LGAEEGDGAKTVIPKVDDGLETTGDWIKKWEPMRRRDVLCYDGRD